MTTKKYFSIPSKRGKTIRNVAETSPRRGTVEQFSGYVEVKLFASALDVEWRIHDYHLSNLSVGKRLVNAWNAKAFNKKLELVSYHPEAYKNGVQKDATHFLTNTDSDSPLGRMMNADLKRLGY